MSTNDLIRVELSRTRHPRKGKQKLPRHQMVLYRCPRINLYRRYNSTFTLRTLTCNRLSHCLFDFDCPDLSIYEQEQYNYQEFMYKTNARSINQSGGMVHDTYASAGATFNDTFVMRKDLRIQCKRVQSLSGGVPTSDLSFDKFVLRFLFKSKDGVLWCFNRPNLDKQYFKEVPDEFGTTLIKNKIIDTQEQRFIEEDEENDVDLERSMWLIVRKKRSINQVLSHFCP